MKLAGGNVSAILLKQVLMLDLWKFAFQAPFLCVSYLREKFVFDLKALNLGKFLSQTGQSELHQLWFFYRNIEPLIERKSTLITFKFICTKLNMLSLRRLGVKKLVSCECVCDKPEVKSTLLRFYKKIGFVKHFFHYSYIAFF